MNGRDTRALLRLIRTRGVGPTLGRRLIEHFGDADRALEASPAALTRIRGIGQAKAERMAAAMRESADSVDQELERAAAMGVRYVSLGDDAYPDALREVPQAPMLLGVRGELRGAGDDRFAVAIVGSRACTAYGVEQAERFAGVLASGGVTIVSGGARGIDSAAHRGAMRAGGRTIAVLGSGLAKPYPPENAGLFNEIVGSGAVVSELPLDTPPAAENFPARNRIISGLSLGVLVIEAAQRSGALITTRVAVEDQGREVFALPGRVDSPASAGVLDLLKQGGAHLVTEPGDILRLLESSARHLHAGTLAARSMPPALFDAKAAPSAAPGTASDPEHDKILASLAEPMTPDELASRASMEPGRLRAALTLLEVQGLVRRVGLQIERCR
ncbi:MAG: DNA-processing protein DprA [Planctomycetota bacterium]